MQSSTEQLIRELMENQKHLLQMVLPHEFNPGMRRILRVVQRDAEIINLLGEELSNNPDNPKVKAQLAELNVRVLKMVEQLSEKDGVIAKLEAKLKDLETPKKEDKGSKAE